MSKKDMDTTSSALVPVTARYIALTSTEDFAAILADNLGGDGISAFDLERVRVPAGGGQFWELANPETGEPESVREFAGVIIAWRPSRSYWASSFGASAAGTPPDCASNDGITGVGNPGGDCLTCTLNQFGSAAATADNPNPRAKACRDQRFLFVLRPGALLPTLVALPPSAVGVVKKYFLALASRATPYYGVVTKFTLSQDRSAGGISYSLAQLAAGDRLTPEEVASVQAYSRAVTPQLARVRDDEHAD